VLLAIVVQFDLDFEQMNVKITFLHGEMEEKIYMKQSGSYTQEGKENKVCLLKSPSMDLSSLPDSDTNGSTLS